MSGGSACGASAWRSESALVCKRSTGVGSYSGSIRQQTLFASIGSFHASFSLFSDFRDGIIVTSRRFGTNVSLPCTANFAVDVFGRSFGIVSGSIRGRFGYSAFSHTVWRSYSSILSKVVSGILADSSLVISLAVIKSSSTMNYEMPAPA
jgi:hypothetical protein